MTQDYQMPVGAPIFDMTKTRVKSGFSISMNLDKKLIFLVMIVSSATLIITGELSFTYADQILKERVADQLIGESAVRGETVRMLLESYILHSNVLAGDPVIQALVSQMNQASAEERNAIHKVGNSPEYGFTELNISEMKKKYGYIVFEVKRRQPVQTTPVMT